MTVSVDLASVLAQVAPVFLLMLLFERIYLGRSTPDARSRFVATGHAVRYIATMLCFLVFVISLVVVGAGSPLTGWVASVFIGIMIALVVALWATIHLSLNAMRERALEQLANEGPGDENHDDNERDGIH